MNIITTTAACFLFIANVQSQLFPIDPEKTENIFELLIPTKRQSLDDCATKYYRYGRNNLASPVLGTPVELSEFSHFVAIGWTQSNNSIEWNCGGSLISDNFVLSAAHCTTLARVQPDKALLGDRYPYSTQDDEFAQLFNILEVIKHEEYRSSSRYFDIALFKIDGNIRPHTTVLPACLWSLDNFLDFKSLEAIGIGQVGFNEDKTQNLEKVSLNPIDSIQCIDYHNNATDRKLGNNLVNHQLCARGSEEGDLRQDTCLGDSGGPLQIKLLANGRITSFIVGITSFGKGCGSDAPGVYTKVASFIEWIESKSGLSFDPRRCALRYVSLREFQPGLLEVADRAGGSSGLTIQDYRSNWINSKIHLARDYRHKAYLGWYKENYIHWYCGASLISERWLLTAAHCTDQTPEIASVGGLRPHSHAEDHLNQMREIEEIRIHPSYSQSDIYHDIALIKLKEDVKLSLDVVPACIWKKHELPTDTFEVVGWGSRTSNLFFIDLPVWEVANDEVFPIVTSECNAECQVNRTKPLENLVDNPIMDEVRLLEINSTILDNQACDAYYSRSNKTRITNNQVCLQNDLFAVPGICNLDIGGPVDRKIWAYNEYDSYVFGVNSFGNNCGFGTPVVATRTSSYADWIEQNVLGITGSSATDRHLTWHHLEEIYFVDEQGRDMEGEACNIPNYAELGKCTTPENCPGVVEEYKSRNQHVKFCGFVPRPSVCCPARFYSKDNGNQSQLRNCASQHQQFRKKPNKGAALYKYEHNKVFAHTAAIGFRQSTRIEYKCWGALISDKFVVTTASCLTVMGSTPVNVRLGNQNFGLATEQQIVRVTKIITHPSYRQGSYYNDITLLGLETSVRFNRNIVPACLWTSEDKVPFIGVVPAPSSTRDIRFSCTTSNAIERCDTSQALDKELRLLTMQNEDCQRYYKPDNVLTEGIVPSQVCAQSEEFNKTNACIRLPGSLYQKSVEVNEVVVPYIVGLYSYDRDCHLDNPAIFTRMSSFIDFIEKQINLHG